MPDCAAPLTIRLFGPFDVRRHGVPLPPLRSRKGQWLLALLTLRAGCEIERAWLAGTLWPDSPERQAFSSLRKSLTDLRGALSGEAARITSPTPHTLRLDLSGAEADVVDFDAAVARGDGPSLERAATLYRGPLLEGCIEEWAFQERRIREQAYLHALESLAEAALAGGDAPMAERYLRLATAVDPLRESAQRRLMQVLAAGGNYAAATAVYRELRLRLHRQMNAEPDAETQTLLRAIRAEACAKAAQVREGQGESVPGLASASAAGISALVSLHHPPHHLPAQTTPLIGRQGDVAAVCDRLLQAAVRLVTLTGPGGIGKTRLALQVTTEMLPAFRDGVFFVSLAPVRDSDLVVTAVARALGVQETQQQSLGAGLKGRLRGRQMLVLLDGFEHLLDAAVVVADLLASAPGLKLLITSRAPLHLRGERQYPVPPLALPPMPVVSGQWSVVSSGKVSRDEVAAARPSLATNHWSLTTDLMQYAAVELFLQRALAVKPDFVVTHENARAVAEICRRLDGLPLAIELAAARIKLLPPQALLACLAGRVPGVSERHPRLELLTGGARDLPARQQTLRDAIAWSYDLLGDDEQRLFARLAVFVGGFSLEAAQAVCDPGGDLGLNVLDGLASLVDSSLLTQGETAAGEARFGMLDTTAEYALERLEASGEGPGTRRSHAHFFLEWAEQSEPGFWANGYESFDRLEVDHANLRAVLAWAAAEGEAAVGLRLAGTLCRFWRWRGYWTEGRTWLERLLALAAARESTPARGKACYSAGHLARWQGDFVRARELLAESVSIWRECHEPEKTARALLEWGRTAAGLGDTKQAAALFQEIIDLSQATGDHRAAAIARIELGHEARRGGDTETARCWYEQSLAISRKESEPWGIAGALHHLAHLALSQQRWEEARALFQEIREIKIRLNSPAGITDALQGLGLAACGQGDMAAARHLLEECQLIRRELRDHVGLSVCLRAQGRVARREGDLRAAGAFYRESLLIRWELRDERALAVELVSLADIACRQGQPERAVRLLGAVRASWQVADGPAELDDHRVASAAFDSALASARAALDPQTFEEAWAAGRGMSLEQVVEEALGNAP